MGLGIHKHQHQIQELSSQITQSIKGAFGVLGFHLRKAKDMILVFLENLKEKVIAIRQEGTAALNRMSHDVELTLILR